MHAHDGDGVSEAPVAGDVGRAFLLREGVAFLNHGSFGACPQPVFETYQRWQRELEAEPVEFLGRSIDELLGEARAALGAYVGVDGDDLVFVPNATTGVNIVARSLDLRPGDEVLGTDHEYGAVERTWTYLCERQGAHYRAQPIALPVTDAESVVEQLWQGVTERTRAIIISHITSPTALTLPVAEICRRARERGILTVVDGAHAPGHISLDLEALGADFYSGNCHKWLCGPKSAGFLYARRERQAMLQPLIVSWGWRPREPGSSPFQDLFGWTGTQDPSAALSVPAAIAFQREHDWPRVRAACHTLLSQARAEVAALTGMAPICPDDEEWYGQMASLPLPVEGLPAKELQRRLFDEHGIEVPINEWGGRRFVRVSIEGYNSPRDVERLLDGLRALI